ncbi:MAG: hypothetical protein V1900_01445 [Candidatus Aenigmatarchaeota archaeon]
MNVMGFVIFEETEKLVSLELTGFGQPCQKLFDQTDASGYEVFCLFSRNNFNNSLQKADYELFNKNGPWIEVFRDTVREGHKGADDKGMLHILYISGAKTNQEKEQYLWVPKDGFWVPTDDGVFYPGTIVPFETVLGKEEARRQLKAKGFPDDKLSFFQRSDNYKNSEMFACRSFTIGPDGYYPFCIGLNLPPSAPGSWLGASRPSYSLVKQGIALP